MTNIDVMNGTLSPFDFHENSINFKWEWGTFDLILWNWLRNKNELQRNEKLTNDNDDKTKRNY